MIYETAIHTSDALKYVRYVTHLRREMSQLALTRLSLIHQF